MKNLRTTFTTILLALGCFSLSPPVKAGQDLWAPPIVGLWDVHYTSNTTGPSFHTYDQWHIDGLEFEVNSVAPGAMCQGTWEQTSTGDVKLYHVGFVFSPNGSLQGPFREAQLITVSPDRNSYNGTYDINYYDTHSHLLLHDTGTMRGTRLSVGHPL